jgi:hypothetical protein
VGLLGSACDMGAAQTPPASPTAPAVSADATPPPSAVPVPTTAPGNATVRGLLLHIDTNRPLTEDDGISLFLAGVINGDFRTAALDKVTAPRALIDIQGNFVFANVPPGEYAVALVTPTSEFLMKNPQNEAEDLIFTVAADKTFELGTLKAKYP